MWESLKNTVKDNIIPIGTAAVVGIVAPAIGQHFLNKGLNDIVKNKKFKVTDIEPVIASAKHQAGLDDMPHRKIDGYNNAFYIANGGLSPAMSIKIENDIDSALSSGGKFGRKKAKLLNTILEFNKHKHGGIVIGDRLTNPHVVAHELGHAKIEHDGGVEAFVQRYAPSLQNIGSLVALGSIVPHLMGKGDIAKGMLYGGLGTHIGGVGAKLYSEYRASDIARDILKDVTIDPETRALGDKSLNYAFGTYLNNSLKSIAPAAALGSKFLI